MIALDPAAMRALLSRAIGRHCPRELAHLREDLVHTALLRVLEQAGGEESPTRTASYLWRVAFTVVMDEIRRYRRGMSRELEVASLTRDERPGPELGVAIRDCLSRLHRSRRTPVVLHLQGFRNEEVARAVRQERKRVENLIYRGLADVRRCLEGKESRGGRG